MEKNLLPSRVVGSKKQPVRTCVACRTAAPKAQLVRLVRTGDGKVVVNEGGKEAGRGAYLCASHACWVEALNKGKLEHALRTRLDKEARERLDICGRQYAGKQVPQVRQSG